jgi:flavin reductase (DIM6/NTAB) family NADH-FMN oxidoreductase RutF
MQTYLSPAELLEMEQRKRAHLINSVGGFKSVCLIATANISGDTNLAIFSSVVHIGANPPLICFIMRPDSVERHTLSNILETGSYTINHINEYIYKQAHQTSARYPKNISEFDAAGLTEEYKNNFKAPFVKESIIQLGVEFKERIDLTINNTTMVIGEINQLYFPGDCLCEDGYLDIEKAGTISCTGLDSYHTTRRLERLSYAKPDAPITTAAAKYIG